MNKSQKLIVMLLVLAILFSGVSIIVSFTALNIDIPRLGTSKIIAESGGGISLTVEKPPVREGTG